MSEYNTLNNRIIKLEELYEEKTIQLNYLDLLKTKTYFNESSIGTVLNSLNPYEAAIFQPTLEGSIASFADLVGIKKGDFVVKIRGGQFLKVDGPEVNTLYPQIGSVDNTITWTAVPSPMPILEPNPGPPVAGPAQARKVLSPSGLVESGLKYYPVVKFYNEDEQEIILYNNRPTQYFAIDGAADNYIVTFYAIPTSVVSYAVIR